MDKVIEEFPDDTTPAYMEKCLNNEDDADTEITSENEDECEIQRDITEYEKDTMRDNLDKLIGKCPDDTSPVDHGW